MSTFASIQSHLLNRVAAVDSIGEMEAAREDRFWDALTCAVEGRHFAACYIVGYVIEMALKTAYFRFQGIRPIDDLGRPLNTARPALRLRMSSTPSPLRSAPLHNLRAWGDELIELRAKQNRPLDPTLAGLLVVELAWVESNWSEVMRYRRSVSAGEEIERMISIADWLIGHYDRFWR